MSNKNVKRLKDKHRGPSPSSIKKREKFKALHPEGRKVYSHTRRGHHCHWVKRGLKNVN